MKVSDIFLRAQTLFGDEGGIQLTGDKVVTWINDAQEEACNTIPNLLPKQSFMDAIAGQMKYDTPTDMYTLWGIKYTESSLQSYYQLAYRSIMDLYQTFDGWDGTLYQSGVPSVFSRENNQLILFPAPREDVTNGIQLTYARYALPVANQSDDVDLPNYLNQFVIDFVMNKAYEMDEDWTAADRIANRVQQRLNEGRSTPEERINQVSFKTVTEVFSDDL